MVYTIKCFSKYQLDHINLKFKLGFWDTSEKDCRSCYCRRFFLLKPILKVEIYNKIPILNKDRINDNFQISGKIPLCRERFRMWKKECTKSFMQRFIITGGILLDQQRE